MVTFAQNLFGGGRVLRWTLLVVALLALGAFASPLPEETTVARAVRLAVMAALLLLALAMVAPRRFHCDCSP